MATARIWDISDLAVTMPVQSASPCTGDQGDPAAGPGAEPFEVLFCLRPVFSPPCA